MNGAITLLPEYAFKGGCLLNYRGNFTFTLCISSPRFLVGIAIQILHESLLSHEPG